VGEPLIDRAGKQARLTMPARWCSTTPALRQPAVELGVALAELRDHGAGRLFIGANEIDHLVPSAAHRALPQVVSACEGAGSAQPIQPIPVEILEATWRWA